MNSAERGGRYAGDWDGGFGGNGEIVGKEKGIGEFGNGGGVGRGSMESWVTGIQLLNAAAVFRVGNNHVLWRYGKRVGRRSWEREGGFELEWWGMAVGEQ
jgi:hypothetical protein